MAGAKHNSLAPELQIDRHRRERRFADCDDGEAAAHVYESLVTDHAGLGKRRRRSGAVEREADRKSPYVLVKPKGQPLDVSGLARNAWQIVPTWVLTEPVTACAWAAAAEANKHITASETVPTPLAERTEATISPS